MRIVKILLAIAAMAAVSPARPDLRSGLPDLPADVRHLR